MTLRQRRFTWLTILVFICCVVLAHVQRGTRSQEYLTISADILNYELTTLDNRPLKLSDYPEKIIVMNFFASWCDPCIENLKDLVLLNEEYKAHQIEIIGLVLNEKDLNSKALLRLVQDQKVSFSVVLDKGEFGESLKKIVNARDVIPQTFVIKDGRIWRHFQGYNPVNSPQLLRKALDELGQGTPSKNPGASF